MIALLVAILVVAFLAGIVALAMPCCFTVLLPAYIAKSFDTLRGRLGMTTVFGAGIATVLLPIAMGVTVITTFVAVNHPLLFVIGGFFMILLGLATLWGMPILPMMTRGVDLKRTDMPSVYTLGVFSGVASSCCAPVLAGVLVLSVLSGSWIPAFFVGLAYVAGMVFPLLVVALLWDRKTVQVPALLRGRMVNIRFLGVGMSLHSSKLIAGSLFIAMGAVTVTLGVVDRMISVPGSDLFGIYQQSLERTLIDLFSDTAVVVLALTIAVGILAAGLFHYIRTRKRAFHRKVTMDEPTSPCQETDLDSSEPTNAKQFCEEVETPRCRSSDGVQGTDP